LNGDIVEEDRIQGVIGPFVQKKQRVFMVPGNHETIATADFLAEMYNITNLHGYAVKYKDVGIFGCGGADVGLTQLTDDELFNTLKKGFEKVKDSPKKIMVTHIHPADSMMEKFSQFVKGSKGLTRAIKEFQPDILICGHVHEAEGIEEKIGKTRVLNVGKKGKIIEI
jgi:Icc-related predicted phosphoesterase